MTFVVPLHSQNIFSAASPLCWLRGLPSVLRPPLAGARWVFCHMIVRVEGYLVEKGRNINSKFFNGYRYVYHHGKDLSSFVFITSIQSRCFT